MKYTKEYIKNLDIRTLEFVKNWLFDTYKKYDLSKDAGKTKKIREYCEHKTDGLFMAYREIKDLTQDIENNGGALCDVISLFDAPND